jgi:hypothetical protein
MGSTLKSLHSPLFCAGPSSRAVKEKRGCRRSPRMPQTRFWGHVTSALVGILLLVHTSALPAHLRMFPPAHNAGAMTIACEKGSCCTPFCYLDGQGKHHCVPSPGESCECGMSAKGSDVQLVPPATEATLTTQSFWLPVFAPCGRTVEYHVVLQNPDLTYPTPPPRATSS